MRVVILGAGGVGGSIGALLHLAGYEVQLVARGRHLARLQEEGLRFRRPSGDQMVGMTASATPEVRAGDVVLLCVKSQDTAAAIAGLPPTTVVCVQNGVENEALVSGKGHRVIGAMALIFAVHLVPGEVALHCGDVPGVIDLGRWPSGVEGAEPVADALRAAGLDVGIRPDIVRWKHAKLVSNLPGALLALDEPFDRDTAAALIAEGEAVLQAAGIDSSPPSEVYARAAHLEAPPIDGAPRPGGSLWQGRARGAGCEIGWLNGYITRIGARVGVPTPQNERVVHALTA